MITRARDGRRRFTRLRNSLREDWEEGPAISEKDLALAADAIRLVNAASEEMAALPGTCNGYAVQGHRESVRINKHLNLELNNKCFSNGKKIIEEFSATGHTLVDNHTLKLIRIPSPGLAKLCLARVDGWGRMPVITTFIAGREALRREHPLFDGLAHNGSQRFVDATPCKTGEGVPPWAAWRIHSELARLADSGHYWLEYLMLLPLAMAAKTLSAVNLLSLISAWVLLEWSADWAVASDPMRMWADLDDQGADPAQTALDWLLKDYPLDIQARPTIRWSPAASFREDAAQTIRAALEPSMSRLTAHLEDLGGALPVRTAAHFCTALGWSDIPETLSAELRQQEASARKAAHAIRKALDHAMTGEQAAFHAVGGARIRDRRPIEPADLLAAEPVRNLAAMECVQTRYWSPFVAGFDALYETEADRPGAPMPHAGVLPLSLRLAAAAGSTLLAKTLAGKVQLPDSLFAPEVYLAEGLPHLDARKHIHAQVKNNFLRYLAFRDVEKRAKGSATPDAWLTWVEHHFLYAGGCGVDSVSALILPAFFFSDLKFKRLLRYEQDDFKEIWSDVRAEIALLYPLYAGHDTRGLKERFASIFRKIADLNLLYAEGIASAQDGGTPPPFLNPAQEDPFAEPSNVFTREHLVLDEAAAPIEIERLGGGNPAALQRMIQRNTPYIALLKRLHAQPAVIQPRLRGWFANGIDFDMARPESLIVGQSESPFVGIDYRPAPRPDVRYTVRILVDFSGSMGRERVGLAKDFALALSLGLRNFDVLLNFYSTKGSFYQLIEVFDSRRRKLGGLAALASICDKKYASGWGWNPDAACLLAVGAIMAREPGHVGRHQNILVYLGDMEFCGSLKPGLAADAAGEVAYAANRLVLRGHRLVIGRCGTDLDPLPEDIPHGYFHLPETGINRASTRTLYQLIQTAISSMQRSG
jgi:hypothetical protein